MCNFFVKSGGTVAAAAAGVSSHQGAYKQNGIIRQAPREKAKWLNRTAN